MQQRMFRTYSQDDAIARTYKKMQKKQTRVMIDLLEDIYTQPGGFKGHEIRKKLMDVFGLLDSVIDESDPDTDLPQIYHAYQTAESLRKWVDENNQLKSIVIKDLFSAHEWDSLKPKYQKLYNTTLDKLFPKIKDWSWLPLIGFIHDLGKVLATEEWGSLPQEFVVGDTFPVNEPFATANVYADNRFFAKNPDLTHKSNYEKHCGFDNLKMSFGHDTYCYSVMKNNRNHFPPEALYIIHYHSFYPWHSPKAGERGYTRVANRNDWLMLPLLKLFQKSDLYSKAAEVPDIKKLEPYYEGLIRKFIPGENECDATQSPGMLRW